jgi:hypothetical protein
MVFNSPTDPHSAAHPSARSRTRASPIVEEIVAVIDHDLGFGQHRAVLRDLSVEDIQQDLDH